MGCRTVWSPARTFTASCDQPATMRVYLDGDRSGACESLVVGEASNVVRFEREGGSPGSMRRRETVWWRTSHTVEPPRTLFSTVHLYREYLHRRTGIADAMEHCVQRAAEPPLWYGRQEDSI
ncbi:hypothetical protein [Methanoculleus chikugoensis]|uniref:hypothetical protein n=1 Tax=Methanoculleus chikugoensis TaxID=118126 RepID=UPI001FB388E4|nr:hypothetical protein [Methanoculleus chikugoensis]